jgi:hypothetical protein
VRNKTSEKDPLNSSSDQLLNDSKLSMSNDDDATNTSDNMMTEQQQQQQHHGKSLNYATNSSMAAGSNGMLSSSVSSASSYDSSIKSDKPLTTAHPASSSSTKLKKSKSNKQKQSSQQQQHHHNHNPLTDTASFQQHPQQAQYNAIGNMQTTPLNVINNNLGYQAMGGHGGHVPLNCQHLDNNNNSAHTGSAAGHNGYSIQNILTFAAQQYASANAVDAYNTAAGQQSNNHLFNQQQLQQQQQNSIMTANGSSSSHKRKHSTYALTSDSNTQHFAKENTNAEQKQSKLLFFILNKNLL